jgi:hypothetical protein
MMKPWRGPGLRTIGYGSKKARRKRATTVFASEDVDTVNGSGIIVVASLVPDGTLETIHAVS